MNSPGTSGTQRSHAQLRVAVLLVIASSTAPARAQDELAAREAELRARIASDSGDLGARCELGFVLVREGRAPDAIAVLDPAIAELGSPGDRAGRARLAACLYNRGRAAELAGDASGARAAYRRSLELRPNETVRERLAALGAEPPERTAEEAALAACREEQARCELDGSATPIASASSPLLWYRVTLRGVMDDDGIPCRRWYAVGLEGERATAVELYGYCNQNTEEVRVSAEIRPLAGIDAALVVRAESEWGEYRGEPAGSVSALVVAWRGGSRVEQLRLGTASSASPRFELDVEITDDGFLIVRRVSGRPPTRVEGRHTPDRLARLLARD